MSSKNGCRAEIRRSLEWDWHGMRRINGYSTIEYVVIVPWNRIGTGHGTNKRPKREDSRRWPCLTKRRSTPSTLCERLVRSPTQTCQRRVRPLTKTEPKLSPCSKIQMKSELRPIQCENTALQRLAFTFVQIRALAITRATSTSPSECPWHWIVRYRVSVFAFIFLRITIVDQCLHTLMSPFAEDSLL